MHISDDVVAHLLDSSMTFTSPAPFVTEGMPDLQRRLESLLAEACGFVRGDAWWLLDLVDVFIILR